LAERHPKGTGAMRKGRKESFWRGPTKRKSEGLLGAKRDAAGVEEGGRKGNTGGLCLYEF